MVWHCVHLSVYICMNTQQTWARNPNFLFLNFSWAEGQPFLFRIYFIKMRIKIGVWLSHLTFLSEKKERKKKSTLNCSFVFVCVQFRIAILILTNNCACHVFLISRHCFIYYKSPKEIRIEVIQCWPHTMQTHCCDDDSNHFSMCYSMRDAIRIWRMCLHAHETL